MMEEHRKQIDEEFTKLCEMVDLKTHSSDSPYEGLHLDKGDGKI